MCFQVGFCTFDSTVHHYNLKSSLSQPQILVVPDHSDPFLPAPDDLLVNLSESRAVVYTLLDSLANVGVTICVRYHVGFGYAARCRFCVKCTEFMGVIDF